MLERFCLDKSKQDVKIIKKIGDVLLGVEKSQVRYYNLFLKFEELLYRKEIEIQCVLQGKVRMFQWRWVMRDDLYYYKERFGNYWS